MVIKSAFVTPVISTLIMFLNVGHVTILVRLAMVLLIKIVSRVQM